MNGAFISFWSLIGTIKSATCLTSCKNWHTAKHLSLPPLSAAEALTSVTAWADTKSSGNLLSFTVGVVAVLWSWWQAAKGVSIQQKQPRGCTGFLFSFVSGRTRSCCHLPALWSCLKDVEAGEVIEVFNWRAPRPGEGDPVELQGTGAHFGWQHVVPGPGGFPSCSVVQPWL